MIAGEVISFIRNSDDPEIDESVLIELTEIEEPFIEIATDVGKRRIYLRFRISDLLREIKEAKE